VAAGLATLVSPGSWGDGDLKKSFMFIAHSRGPGRACDLERFNNQNL
jgi:hypothetical protein